MWLRLSRQLQGRYPYLIEKTISYSQNSRKRSRSSTILWRRAQEIPRALKEKNAIDGKEHSCFSRLRIPIEMTAELERKWDRCG
jgi:hypothetical protein